MAMTIKVTITTQVKIVFQKALKKEWFSKSKAKIEEFALGVVFQGLGQLIGLCRFQQEKGAFLKRHLTSLGKLIEETLVEVG